MQDTADLILRFGLTLLGCFIFFGICRIALHFYRQRKSAKKETKSSAKISPNDIGSPQNLLFSPVRADETNNGGESSHRPNKISFAGTSRVNEELNFTFRGGKTIEEVLEEIDSPKANEIVETNQNRNTTDYRVLVSKIGTVGNMYDAVMETGREPRLENIDEFNTEREKISRLKSDRDLEEGVRGQQIPQGDEEEIGRVEQERGEMKEQVVQGVVL